MGEPLYRFASFYPFSRLLMLFFLNSYDARDEVWNLGARWSDEFVFGGRAYFDLSSIPADSCLRVDRIQKVEEAVYRCRVDFKSAPTRNTLVNVSVIGELCVHICDTIGVKDNYCRTPFLHNNY